MTFFAVLCNIRNHGSTLSDTEGKVFDYNHMGRQTVTLYSQREYSEYIFLLSF